MKRVLAVMLSAVLAATVFSGCGQKNEDVIKIGIFEPLSGANAAGGQLEVEGMELANELRPTVLGKKKSFW